MGCVLGDLIGTLFTFDAAGIEFSMTALFVTVFVEQWLTTKNHLPAIIGLICSIVCLVIFGANNFLIPAMISIAVVLLSIRKSEKIGGE